MIRVSGEYHSEEGDLTSWMSLERFEEYSSRGTCCVPSGSTASFAPNQMVRSLTVGRFGLSDFLENIYAQ